MADTNARSGLEPELGGLLRAGGPERSGLEPELGGSLRQKGVYVDEVTCIGCRHCSHVARNTFFIEPNHGRARAISQNSDSESLIQEAMDTCPVDCIHWVDFTELKQLETERPHQEITLAGMPVQASARRRRRPKRVASSAPKQA
jgi:ferredoxin